MILFNKIAILEAEGEFRGKKHKLKMKYYRIIRTGV